MSENYIKFINSAHLEEEEQHCTVHNLKLLFAKTLLLGWLVIKWLAATNFYNIGVGLKSLTN